MMHDKKRQRKPSSSQRNNQKRMTPHSNLRPSSRGRSGSHHRYSSRRFKRGFRYYILALSIILGMVLIYLFISLAAYQHRYNIAESEKEAEKSAVQAPQLTFEAYYGNMDTDKWVEAWYKAHPDHLDTEEDVRSFMELYADPSICSIYKDSSYSDISPAYLVQSGGQDFAVMTLDGSSADWWVSDITFKIAGSNSGSVSVPEGSSVYCNGQLLGDSYISGSATAYADFKYSSSIINPVNYVTYSVSDIISEPVFTADISSSDYSVTADINGNYYLSLPDDQATTIKTAAHDFVKSLLYYFSQGKNNASENMNAVIALVPSGSDAADIIRQSYDGVIWRVASNSIYDIDVSDICVISGNCYFTDVTCAETSESASAESSGEPTIYRLYFMDLGAGFKIYSFSYE